MAKRKKILVLCDAPTIKTGLSRVGRELANRFHRDNYEVYYAGWFHNPLPHEYPFYICQVIRNHSDESGWIRTLIRKTKPDIFLAIGDIWYFDYCSGIFEQLKKEGIEIPERWLYLTLDAEPFFPDWMGIIKAFTKVYPQSQFAVNEIQKVDPYFSGKAVWLGVDKKTFYPLPEKPKWKDRFVVMVNGYNCSRKNIPASLKAFAKFAYDKEDVLLFINSQLNTHVGTDLKRQIFQYGIQFKTVFDKDKSDNKEVPDSTVNTYYNSADCLLFTSTGEGFGLPILEAFSTKTLVLATDYTTTDELIGKDRGIKLKVAEYFTGEYELQRALVDVDDTVEKLNFVYADWKNGKPEAKKLTENAYDFVQDLTWEKTYREILSKPKVEEWKTF